MKRNDKDVQLNARELARKLKELERERYKVLVFCGSPLCGKTTLAQIICKENRIRYVDFTAEVLPNITSPTLGVFGANEFLDWLRQKANKSQNYLCVDEIESLLATFPKRQAVDFFSMVKSLETRYPNLLVTRLKNVLSQSDFPSERMYHIDEGFDAVR